MKGSTLRDRWVDVASDRPTVIADTCCYHWIAFCDARAYHDGRYIWERNYPTHAEALAAAKRHALEHLGEDTARWAADTFAVGSEVWQEDQQ